MGINPLRVRVTTTLAGDVHLSYEDDETHVACGIDLKPNQARHLARVIHRTPLKGLEALASLFEQALGQMPAHDDHRGDAVQNQKSLVFGQINAAEDYGTLRAPK